MSTTIEKVLTPERRAQLEGRLASYNIPLQILEMVAERSKSDMNSSADDKVHAKKTKRGLVLSKLNDDGILMLAQIFLDCDDSFSGFRFAVFLSSIYSPMMHKFVMDCTVEVKPGLTRRFDIGIYSRNTQKLVAVGMQNNQTQRAADGELLSQFLATVAELKEMALRGAYFSSSYGYADADRWRLALKDRRKDETEIRAFEFRDRIYFEIKPQ